MSEKTFMGEPALMRWKPLNRDESRLALWQSMHKRDFGNPGDDKLMLVWLWEHGYALCQRVPDEVLNRRAPAQPEPAAPRGEWHAGWLVSNSEGDEEFVNNESALEGRHYRGGSPLALTASFYQASKAAAPTVVEPVDDVTYLELTDAECDEFRRHRGDFNSMLRTVHSYGHYRHAGRLIAHLGAVFNERFDRALAATPPRAALTREQAIALWADKSDGPSNSEIVSYCRAIEAAHGITADRGEK